VFGRGSSAASTVETPRGASPKPGRRLRPEKTPHFSSKASDSRPGGGIPIQKPQILRQKSEILRQKL